MVLVAGDHAKFYASTNLKEWELLSTFGKEVGAHGGVWECPDLFKLKGAGSSEEKWVLLISIGAGGPNGGSGTQYFIGDFDGEPFVTDQKAYKWLDWGTDNYAGVTYNNTPNKKRIFMGWMSNWRYALTIPTMPWRSAMTIPRELSLHRTGDNYFLKEYPIAQFDKLLTKGKSANITLPPKSNKTRVFKEGLNQSELVFSTTNQDFRLEFKDNKKELLTLAFDDASNLVILDRTNSELTDFHPDFANTLQYMVLDRNYGEVQEIRILMDRSSLELFVNKGQYVMTVQLFPTSPYTDFTVCNTSEMEMQLKGFQKSEVGSVWNVSVN